MSVSIILYRISIESMNDCHCRMIWIPPIVALLVTVASLITICPEAFAVVVNSRTIALYRAPVAA